MDQNTFPEHWYNVLHEAYLNRYKAAIPNIS